MAGVTPSSADASAASCGGIRYGAPRLDFSLPARMTLPGAVAGRPSALRPSPPPHGAGIYVRISAGLAVTVFYPGNVVSFGFAPALPSPFSFCAFGAAG